MRDRHQPGTTVHCPTCYALVPEHELVSHMWTEHGELPSEVARPKVALGRTGRLGRCER